MMNTLQRVWMIFVFLAGSQVFAQQIKGKVLEDGNDSPVIGATVKIAGKTQGTLTDVNGEFSLAVPAGTSLEFTFIGFVKVVQPAAEGMVVRLKPDATTLNEVVVSVGSRSSKRTLTDTPLPVDIVGNRDLVSTGQPSFDKALQYRIPSFNTVQTPVNDATSLLDPYEIRNMGPSRTLILINGKRKNMSSLLYTQTSPGRGETGADISAIPTDMIERVEILRDGASAQYGSDAIAGVMNIILKKNVDQGQLTVRTGITHKGDGEMMGISLNNGQSFGKNGFVNYTLDLSQVGLANRPGMVDAEGEAADFGANINDVRAFLAKRPDAGNINGSPETTALKFATNAGGDLGSGEWYANGAYVYKKVNSFANFRTPYWRTLSSFPYLKDFFGDGTPASYQGYVPTFDGDLKDYNATLGFKSEKLGWTSDVSLTIGGNEQTYTVTNSHNRNGTKNPDGTNKYRENSPIIFKPGGTRFNHIVGNLDLSKAVSDKVTLAFGSEFRSENFEVIAGDLASYEDGGADSFAGNDPRNSGKFNRYNLGGYADVLVDFTEDFLINATARYENYSDFGDAFVWKLSSRYKLMNDKITLRSSLSTGFKAPTLHQIYTQKAQYSFVPGQGIQVGGLVSNVSREARLLGVPSLNPERSLNFTAGLGVNPNRNTSFTLDFYSIAVKDRIILSTEIGSTAAGNSALDRILKENNLSDLSFFVNAMNTQTTGLDFVSAFKNIALGKGKLAINVAGNYTFKNERVGAVNNPALVAQAGQSVANVTQEALFFTSRPQYKAIAGLDWEVGGWNFLLNNTLFGPTRFKQQGLDLNLYTEFDPKIVTDLAITRKIGKSSIIQFTANNFLNVLPTWRFKAENAKGEALLKDAKALKMNSNLITFNQRYSQMTYDGYHFSQLGANFAVTYQFRF